MLYTKSTCDSSDSSGSSSTSRLQTLSFRGSRRLHVFYCAPGAPGCSTLASLIAAQQMNNRKALLPDPNAVQIMKNLNTPAMLQMLLQPQLHGCVNKLVLGTPLSVPHLVSPSISPAFLHLSTVHQCLKQQYILKFFGKTLLLLFRLLTEQRNFWRKARNTQNKVLRKLLLQDAPATLNYLFLDVHLPGFPLCGWMERVFMEWSSPDIPSSADSALRSRFPPIA
uniref:Uncharacterized protein n=1 Tax=Varanus komodoensis TaxID=61221 RepID=A0A8D2L1K8_VARKO